MHTQEGRQDDTSNKFHLCLPVSTLPAVTTTASSTALVRRFRLQHDGRFGNAMRGIRRGSAHATKPVH